VPITDFSNFAAVKRSEQVTFDSANWISTNVDWADKIAVESNNAMIKQSLFIGFIFHVFIFVIVANYAFPATNG
jgi:hypothetical protein